MATTLSRPFIPPDVADQPFRPAIECVMDLPFPPSVNRIWRSFRTGVTLAPEYRAWKDEADMAVLANGCWRRRVAMPRAFTAAILLDGFQRSGDLDNRIKAVLDWAQRVELVHDDALCEEITARWVPTPEAPRGCRLILRPVEVA